MFILSIFSLGAAHAYEVTDEMGATVAFAQPPQRVVSLLPSLTETVCALGERARAWWALLLFQFSAARAPAAQVGGGLDPGNEAIVGAATRRGADGNVARAGERLRALGLKVVALEPKTHADAQRVVLQLGQVLGATMRLPSGRALRPRSQPQPSYCRQRQRRCACILR